MPILTTLILSGIAASVATKVIGVTKNNKRARKITRKVKKYTTSLRKTTKTEKALSPIEREIRQQQQLSLGALSFFSLGMLSYPAFALVGFPLLAYNYIYYLKKIREAYLKIELIKCPAV